MAVKDVITSLEWDMDVVGGEQLSVVLFYSRSSAPSTKMIHLLTKIESYYPNIRIFSTDVDRVPEIVWRFRVSIVPTIMIFRNEQKLHELITARTMDEVRAAIECFVSGT